MQTSQGLPSFLQALQGPGLLKLAELLKRVERVWLSFLLASQQVMLAVMAEQERLSFLQAWLQVELPELVKQVQPSFLPALQLAELGSSSFLQVLLLGKRMQRFWDLLFMPC